MSDNVRKTVYIHKAKWASLEQYSRQATRKLQKETGDPLRRKGPHALAAEIIHDWIDRQDATRGAVRPADPVPQVPAAAKAPR